MFFERYAYHLMNISVCTIMKNEEDNIDLFLSTIKKLGLKDIVLVDTGSEDKSVEIANKYIDKVHFKKWNNDFSEARNYAASKAEYDNILVLDVDEIITEISADEVGKSLPLLGEKIGRIYLNNFTTSDGIKSNHYVWLPRIYNRKYAHFSGAIHEQIVPIRDNKIQYFDFFTFVLQAHFLQLLL